MALHTQIGDRLQSKVVTFKDAQGVAVAAPTQGENVCEIHVRSGADNVNPIFVGDASGQSWRLFGNDTLKLSLSVPSEVFVRGTANEKAVVLLVRSTGEFKQATCNV